MKLNSARLLAVSTALGGVALVAACGGSPNSSANDERGNSGSPHQGGSVTLAVAGGSSLSNLNTQLTSDTTPLILADVWADGLFAYDSKGGQVNHLATGVNLSKDRRTYTISLRKNVKFSDGKAFSSADVAFNLQVLAKFNTYFTSVLPKIAGVTTPDESTVVIKLKEPFAPFLGSLDKEVFPILPKHLYQNGDPAMNPANQKPVGLGPYKFESRNGGQGMTFVRNTNYWDAPKPYLDKVIVRSIPDAQQQVNAILKGEVDWTKLAYPDVKRVQKGGDGSNVVVKSVKTPAPETLVLDLNTARSGPLAKPAVRKALYVGLDRSKIIADAYDGLATVPRSAIPDAFHQLYDPSVDYTKTYAFDAKKAGQMLDDAGYPMKNGRRFSISLSYIAGNPEYPFDAAARIVSAQWKSIGVDLKLDGLDAQVWTDKVYNKRKFDVSMISLTGRTDPALGIDRSFLCNEKNLPFVNATGYCDPNLDAVALQAQQAPAAERQAVYGKYEKLVADALPQLPLAQAEVFEGFSSKFGGLDKQFDVAYNEHVNWAEVWTK